MAVLVGVMPTSLMAQGCRGPWFVCEKKCFVVERSCASDLEDEEEEKEEEEGEARQVEKP